MTLNSGIKLYVRVSNSRNKVVIHKESCYYYRNRDCSISQWYGPYNTVAEAEAKAEELARVPYCCGHC